VIIWKKVKHVERVNIFVNRLIDGIQSVGLILQPAKGNGHRSMKMIGAVNMINWIIEILLCVCERAALNLLHNGNEDDHKKAMKALAMVNKKRLEKPEVWK
jgi:uncharacterized membrane protein YozB (DUF420 family)